MHILIINKFSFYCLFICIFHVYAISKVPKIPGKYVRRFYVRPPIIGVLTQPITFSYTLRFRLSSLHALTLLSFFLIFFFFSVPVNVLEAAQEIRKKQQKKKINIISVPMCCFSFIHSFIWFLYLSPLPSLNLSFSLFFFVYFYFPLFTLEFSCFIFFFFQIHRTLSDSHLDDKNNLTFIEQRRSEKKREEKILSFFIETVIG